MKKLEIFQNKSFGRIRTLAINNDLGLLARTLLKYSGMQSLKMPLQTMWMKKTKPVP